MDINIIAADNLRSPLAEAFRSFRTNIQFYNMDKSIKSLVITSSLPGEGKSTIAFNLAVSMAQTEKNVLLIDADFRKPSIQMYIKPKHYLGLTNIIIQDIYYREILQLFDGLKNLGIMLSGPIPPNPSEILGSSKMKALIQEFQQDYDMVILDSPPVGLFTDAAVLSTIVDGVVMVCVEGKTKREDISKSISNLTKVNANLIGIVMNKAKLKKNSSYNDYYYRKGK